MTADPPADVILIGPPRLDGGGRRRAQWRRALAHRALRGASRALLIGPLTARGRPAEAAGIAESLSVFSGRTTVLPGPGDLPTHGRSPGWLTPLVTDTLPTRPIALGDRRTALIPLDTLRLTGGRDAIGATQLADLEARLAARPDGARTILALAHDPHGRPATGAPLADREALAALLRRHPVGLIVHGQRDALTRGRFAGIPTLSPPPLDGCALTGWRALVRVGWAEDGSPAIEPLHFARPESRPALAEAFAAVDAAGAWTDLAEKIVAADDTFAALAAELRARAARLDAVDAHAAALDGALADLIRRAGGPGDPSRGPDR